MSTPIHLKDQQDAARQDALRAAMVISGAKLLVLFAVYPDHASAAIAGINTEHCTSDVEMIVGSKLGRALGERMAAMYAYLEEQAAKGGGLAAGSASGWLKDKLDEINWTRLAPDPPDVNLVAEAAEAIIRHLVRVGTFSLPGHGHLTLDQAITHAKGLATLAMTEDWQKLQKQN